MSGLSVSASSHHRVQFYEDDAFLVDRVGSFIGSALSAGQPGIVIATGAHRRKLESIWGVHGIDVAAAQRSGQLILGDAEAMLAEFMVDGSPDPQRFQTLTGELLKRAASQGRHDAPIRAFGEMVDLLWARGESGAALRLEDLWNELARWHSFSLLCAYPLARFASHTQREAFLDVCARHARVIPAESYPAAEDDSDERLRAVAILQQKAHALEAEVARRRTAEQELLRREAELRELYERAERVRSEPGPVLPEQISIERSVRILVVEDSADVAEALAQLLEVLGHQVRTVHDGSSAIEAARAEMPELMFVDIGLPEMDGYEVARRVRALPGAGRAILVALTGHGTAEDRRKSHDAGFDDHLVKPAAPQAIQAIVAALPDRSSD